MPEEKLTRNYVDSHDVSLKEYFDTRFDSLEKYIDGRFTSIYKSTETALVANEKRLDGLNELRTLVENRDKMFATIAVVDSLEKATRAEIERLRSSIESLNITRAELSSKVDQSQLKEKADKSQITTPTIASGFAVVMGLITIIIELIKK
jgi:hypothetical protein